MDVLENAQNFVGLMSRVPGITVPLESNTPDDTEQEVVVEEVTKKEKVTPVVKKQPVVYNTYEDQKASNVKLLQTTLNKVQTSTTPLVVDGLLGPNTYASLHAYQAQNNLTKRNWIDEDTARLLNAANANTTSKKIAVNLLELNKLKSPQDRFDFIPSKENYKHVRQIQDALGLTDDGKWGPITQAAWSKYLKSKNISNKTFEEQIVAAIRTDPKKFEKANFYSFKKTKPKQDLITSALNYAGIDESPTKNSVVYKVLRNAIGFQPDKQPWCAAVVAELLKQSSYNMQNPGVFDLPGGQPNPFVKIYPTKEEIAELGLKAAKEKHRLKEFYAETGSRYWQKAGKRINSTVFTKDTETDKINLIESSTTEIPQSGDIIVFNRGKRTDPDASFETGTKGHLGILIHKYPDGSVVVLGGNQRNPALQNYTTGNLNVTVFTAKHIQKYYPAGYVINRASGLDSVDPKIVSNLLNSFGKKTGGSTE